MPLEFGRHLCLTCDDAVVVQFHRLDLGGAPGFEFGKLAHDSLATTFQGLLVIGMCGGVQ